mgnify:CR=1 FL=1
MKKLFIMLAAAATVVSCAKEQTIVADQGEAIEFGNVFVDNATRANDPSYSANDITAFKVYGTVNNVNILDGDDVKKTANYGEAWSLTEAGTDTPIELYWIPGADYKFVGIVDGDKEGVTKTNVENKMPLSVEYTADGVTDLLCQTITKTAKTDGTANGLVAFNFNHLLSKVNFTVKNNSTEADGHSFVVKNITFNGATKATYDVVNKEWKTASATGDTALTQIAVASGAASADLGTEVLFIPGEYSISFTVDILYNGNVITSTNYPASPTTYTHTLVAGNAYNFNVAVSVGELIEFTVTKQPSWADGDGADDTTLTL